MRLEIALCAALGALAIYCAAFLYENEERQLQNKLEDWWLRAAEAQGGARFLRIVAAGTSGLLDRIFGPRLFSLRALWPTAALSVASILALQSPWFVLFAVLAIAPAFLSPRLARFHPFVVAVAFIIYVYLTGHSHGWDVDVARPGYGHPSKWRILASACATLAIAACANLVFLAGARSLIRWLERRSSILIFAGALGLLVLALVLLVVPFLVAMGRTDVRLGMILIEAAAASLFALPVALVFFAVAIALIVHRVTWPLLERASYAFVRFEVIRNRKVLAAAGVSLLALAFPPIQNVLRALFSLAKGNLPEA